MAAVLTIIYPNPAYNEVHINEELKERIQYRQPIDPHVEYHPISVAFGSSLCLRTGAGVSFLNANISINTVKT